MNIIKKTDNTTIKTKIKKFIMKNFPLRRKLDDDDSFLDKGIIDSSGVLELVEFIE